MMASSIVLNTSVAASKGQIATSAYSATQAALRSLTRTAAAELPERGIRVNAVAPGPISKPIWHQGERSQKATEEFQGQIISAIPMKRFGQPEEVAGVVAFLASKDASHITGAEIGVDGGLGQV